MLLVLQSRRIPVRPVVERPRLRRDGNDGRGSICVLQLVPTLRNTRSFVRVCEMRMHISPVVRPTFTRRGINYTGNVELLPVGVLRYRLRPILAECIMERSAEEKSY